MNMSRMSLTLGTQSTRGRGTNMPLLLCAFCGATIERKNSCNKESCQEASARIATADETSLGVPRIRRDFTQPERLRVRKAHQMRLLPSAHDSIRRAASRERITMAELVERWALTLPAD